MRTDSVSGAEVKCPHCDRDLFVLIDKKGVQIMKRSKKKIKTEEMESFKR